MNQFYPSMLKIDLDKNCLFEINSSVLKCKNDLPITIEKLSIPKEFKKLISQILVQIRTSELLEDVNDYVFLFQDRRWVIESSWKKNLYENSTHIVHVNLNAIDVTFLSNNLHGVGATMQKQSLNLQIEAVQEEMNREPALHLR